MFSSEMVCVCPEKMEIHHLKVYIHFFLFLRPKSATWQEISLHVGVLIHHLELWWSFLCHIVHFVLLLAMRNENMGWLHRSRVGVISLEGVTSVVGYLQVLYNHRSRFCPTQLKDRDLPVSPCFPALTALSTDAACLEAGVKFISPRLVLRTFLCIPLQFLAFCL